MPPFVQDTDVIEDQLYMEQLLEWLGLITLESPRTTSTDTIDSYLCRYALPEAFDSENAPEQNLVHVRWHGFTSHNFARHIWLIMRAATTGKSDSWFSLSGKAFGGISFTTLCHDGQNVLLWECD
jgi:ribonuclease P/MRP protein subunit RPP40